MGAVRFPGVADIRTIPSVRSVRDILPQAGVHGARPHGPTVNGAAGVYMFRRYGCAGSEVLSAAMSGGRTDPRDEK